jgi:Rieske Fe-S protein
MTDVRTGPATEAQQEQPRLTGTRRSLLAGAGALSAGCLLAACGTDSGGTVSHPNGADFTDDPVPAGSALPGDGSGDAGGAGGTPLASVADVPVGGGVIKGDLVFTQPTKGDFKAFSKVCTHAGCPVTKVEDGVIFCPCHKSTFSIADGSPQGGPATKPLPETKIKVDGDNLVEG